VVAVSLLPFKGGEGIMGLIEESSDCVGHHVGYFVLGARRGP
jgi:hypothetical protein